MVGRGFSHLFKIPELKRKILFTLGLLAIYRIGAHIPTPGIDATALAEFFNQTKGTVYINMVSIESAKLCL